jgi:hypothetical protein
VWKVNKTIFSSVSSLLALTIVIEVIVGTKRANGRRLMFLSLNEANFQILYDMIRYLFTAIGFLPDGSGR